MSVNYSAFIQDLESRMQLISENAYTDAISRAWWNRVAKSRPVASRAEILSWLLSTGQIKESDGEGQIRFEDLVRQTATVEVGLHTDGMRITKSQVDDFAAGAFGGEALENAAEWSANKGAEAALYPQDRLAAMILAGETATGYDGVPYFSTAHPLNPFRPEVGTYSNLLTGGTYAIHSGTADAAAAAFSLACGKVSEIKTANGATSRRLQVVGLLHPPALKYRAQIVTGARFVGGTAGSTDIEMITSPAGIEPIEAPELGLAFGGSDTAYYLVTSGASRSQLGAFVHADREPFAISYFGPEGSSELVRNRQLQYTIAGRMEVAYGHGYGLVKVTGA